MKTLPSGTTNRALISNIYLEFAISNSVMLLGSVSFNS
jgi:hypothetical protein